MKNKTLTKRQKKDLEIQKTLNELKQQDPLYEEKLLKIVKEELDKLRAK